MCWIPFYVDSVTNIWEGIIMEIRYHLFDSNQTILAMIKYLLFGPAPARTVRCQLGDWIFLITEQIDSSQQWHLTSPHCIDGAVGCTGGSVTTHNFRISTKNHHSSLIRLRGATVARLTPDQKAACSNHVGVKIFFPQFDNDTFVQKACLQWGLNSWPLVYKTNALPLSYRGPCGVDSSIIAEDNIHW